MDIEWIGSGIKYHRNRRGLTVEQLSGLSSVEPSTISHAENGTDKLLSFEKIINILNALDINFSDCFHIISEKQLIAHKIKMEVKQNFKEEELVYLNSLLKHFSSANEVNYGEDSKYIGEQDKALSEKEKFNAEGTS